MILAVVNRSAGGGRCGRRADRVIPELRAFGLDLDVRQPGSAEEASRTVREEWSLGRRRFLAVGGDGTVFDVLNGLFPAALGAGHNERPSLGILPLGTGNSFVRDFSPTGSEYSIEALRAGRSRPCDVFRVDHREGTLFALGTVSLAFPADVAALVNRRLKPFGAVGYILGVFACLSKLRPLSVSLAVDGRGPENLETVLLCAQNNCTVGGSMRMAPTACIDDGEGDLVIAGRVGRVDLLRTFPKIFEGTHIDHPAVSVRRFRSLRIETAGDLDVMVDGESLRLGLRGVDVVPGALDLLL